MSEEIVKPKPVPLAKRISFLDELDDSIDAATAEIIKSIKEDRDRAEEVYLELLNLYNQGKNNPDDLRELNKAQELVQRTTDQLQKVFATLAKIKTGDARVQIAQINASKEEVKEVFDRADLIKMVEELEDEEKNREDLQNSQSAE